MRQVWTVVKSEVFLILRRSRIDEKQDFDTNKYDEKWRDLSQNLVLNFELSRLAGWLH